MNHSQWHSMETAGCKGNLLRKHTIFWHMMHVHKMLKNVNVCLEGDDFRFCCQHFTIKYTFLLCLVLCQTWRHSSQQEVMMVKIKLLNQSRLFTLWCCCPIVFVSCQKTDLHLCWSDAKSCFATESVISAIHTNTPQHLPPTLTCMPTSTLSCSNTPLQKIIS